MNPTTSRPELTRRGILQGMATLAASSLFSGCGAGKFVPNAYLNPQPTPTGGTITPATLTVSSTANGSVEPSFAGFSYEKAMLYQRLLTATNGNLIGLFQLLGTNLLRIGGNSVDRNVWTPTGAGKIAGQIAPSDVDALAGFLKASGSQCIYGIDLKLSSTGPSAPTTGAATTPALAAAEVAYVVNSLGGSLYGIEIGNEPELYGWTYAQYIAQWTSFRDAIVAACPTVNIVGPVTGSLTWFSSFSQYVASNSFPIELLSFHYYISAGPTPTGTSTDLVNFAEASASPGITTLIADLQSLQSAATTLGVPYRMAECNNYWNGGNGVADSYAAALWSLDFMFACAQYGATGVNFHGGGDTPDFTPIADDSNGNVVGARPEYYGMAFFSMAGTGQLNTTTLSAGSLNVNAYAIQTTTGGLNIMIVNKDPDNHLQMAVTLPKAATSAKMLVMTQLLSTQTGPSLAAVPVSATSGDQGAGITIQGAQISNNGVLTPYFPYNVEVQGTQLSCYVPLLSAVLIQIS